MLKSIFSDVKFRFDDETEQLYRSESYSANITVIRIYLILSIVLFALFALLDQLSLPESWGTAFFIRFFVVIPVLVLTLSVSYMPFFERYNQRILTVVAIVMAYSILVMIAVSDSSEVAFFNYYPGLFIISFSSIILLQLRMIYSIILTIAVIAGYEFVVYSIQGMHKLEYNSELFAIFLNNNIYFVSIASGGVIVGFILEYFKRKSFISGLEIKVKLKEIEEKNREIYRQKTNLTKTLDELKATQEKLTSIINNDIAGINVIDLNMRYLFVNHAWCSMLGYEESELLQKKVLYVTHVDDKEITNDFFKQAIDGTLWEYHLEKRYIRKDGSTFWGDLFISPVYNGSGSIEYVISIIVDITNRKAIEQNLIESEQNLLKSNNEKDNYLNQLKYELKVAAGYAKSLLPDEINEGILHAEWRLIPSADLGGDHFGYHWIDNEHFAMYLVDVCGHGVAPALHAISVINVLRNKTLPNTDFTDPVSVLSSLNKTFQMEKHNDMYFTMWYGVFNKYTRELLYASAGHPGAMLIDMEGNLDVLETDNYVMGDIEDFDYKKAEVLVNGKAFLFIFSDGVFEIETGERQMWTQNDLYNFLGEELKNPESEIDALYNHAISLNKGKLDDDFSMLKITFNGKE